MQQINLYLPEFRPNREPFRTIHLLVALPIFILLLIAASIATHFKANELEADVVRKSEQLKKVQFQLQVLKANKPSSSNQSLDLQLQEVETKLEHRKQILSMVTREDFGNMAGFSDYLKGFSEAGLPDIALDQFKLNSGGTYVEFSGETRSASLVPEYIQRLRSQPSFKNARMGVLEIQPSTSSFLTFSVNKPKKSGGDR